jgi:hypothetical protein
MSGGMQDLHHIAITTLKGEIVVEQDKILL